MQIEKEKMKLYPFYNHYCDALYASLGEFLTIDEENINQILSNLTAEDWSAMCDYCVVKNIKAGVKELNLKVYHYGDGLKALDKYAIKGKEIISAKEMNVLPTSAMVGDRLLLEVESLLDYQQDYLNALVDFSAKTDIPVLFKIGQKLDEVGKLVNIYRKSPMEILENYGFLDRECYVYGLNFIDKEDQKLLSQYDVKIIFSPISDGEEGLGAINLYNFIYNELKFGFSSGKCYNINMLEECKLAKINTSNLMYDNKLLTIEQLLSGVIVDYDFQEDEKIEIDLDECEPFENILNKRVDLKQDDFFALRQKVIEIAGKIKEKI